MNMTFGKFFTSYNCSISIRPPDDADELRNGPSTVTLLHIINRKWIIAASGVTKYSHGNVWKCLYNAADLKYDFVMTGGIIVRFSQLSINNSKLNELS